MIKLKLDKQTLWNFTKYLAIGGSAFVIEITLFLLLRERVHYIIANIVIYTIMFWSVFLANKFFNFKSRTNFGKQLRRYTILYFINLVVTNLMLYILGDYFGLDTAIGKVIVTGCACSWNFLLYKYVIYVD